MEVEPVQELQPADTVGQGGRGLWELRRRRRRRRGGRRWDDEPAAVCCLLVNLLKEMSPSGGSFTIQTFALAVAQRMICISAIPVLVCLLPARHLLLIPPTPTYLLLLRLLPWFIREKCQATQQEVDRSSILLSAFEGRVNLQIQPGASNGLLATSIQERITRI